MDQCINAQFVPRNLAFQKERYQDLYQKATLTCFYIVYVLVTLFTFFEKLPAVCLYFFKKRKMTALYLRFGNVKQ